MIHVLLCPHILDYGGSQLGVLHWAKHLDKSRFKVSILAMGEGGLSSQFESIFSVFYDDIDYPNILGFIKKIKPDILHACPPGGKSFEYITKAAGLVPVTQTSMCPRVVGNKGDVSGSVVISEYVLSLQEDAQDAVCIDLPLDVSGYEIKYTKEYFGLPENKLIIGSLGNERKENAHFMKIARNFKNKDVHFAIKTNEKYKYFFGRDKITVINRYLDEDEKLSFFNCLDVFLYPTSNEAYGLVFLEAMSQKVPIISYEDTAMPEVVSKGGLLAPLNDINRLMLMLEDLVKSKDKRKRLGQFGYDLFRKRNSPEVIAKKYETFFDNILRKG